MDDGNYNSSEGLCSVQRFRPQGFRMSVSVQDGEEITYAIAKLSLDDQIDNPLRIIGKKKERKKKDERKDLSKSGENRFHLNPPPH